MESTGQVAEVEPQARGGEDEEQARAEGAARQEAAGGGENKM